MKRLFNRAHLTSAAILVCVSAFAAHAQRGKPAANPLAGLDAYIEKAMHDHDVPGIAIAVVRNDSLVYAKGYGVRKLGSPERVDENTLFAIGSTSKSFTAAADRHARGRRQSEAGTTPRPSTCPASSCMIPTRRAS